MGVGNNTKCDPGRYFGSRLCPVRSPAFRVFNWFHQRKWTAIPCSSLSRIVVDVHTIIPHVTGYQGARFPLSAMHVGLYWRPAPFKVSALVLFRKKAQIWSHRLGSFSSSGAETRLIRNTQRDTQTFKNFFVLIGEIWVLRNSPLIWNIDENLF